MFGYYLNLALRSFKRNKAMTALMVLAIALGIGASMTTLTVFHVLSGDPIPSKSSMLFYPQIDAEGMTGYMPGEEPARQMSRFDAETLLRQKRGDRQAMMTGDEKNLPPRDKGPVRRFVRDSVDGRFNLGEMLLPLMLSVLVLSLFAGTWATYVFLGVYILILVAVLDAFLLWRRTKPRLLERFGADTEMRGLGMYQAMRAFQMRRTRMPKAMVERGPSRR